MADILRYDFQIEEALSSCIRKASKGSKQGSEEVLTATNEVHSNYLAQNKGMRHIVKLVAYIKARFFQ